MISCTTGEAKHILTTCSLETPRIASLAWVGGGGGGEPQPRASKKNEVKKKSESACKLLTFQFSVLADKHSDLIG